MQQKSNREILNEKKSHREKKNNLQNRNETQILTIRNT